MVLNNPCTCCSSRSSDPGPEIDVVEESPEKGEDGITYFCFVLGFSVFVFPLLSMKAILYWYYRSA